MFNSLRKYAVMVVGALMSFFGINAYADVPASVTTGITTAVTDVGTIGAAIMGVVIAIVAFVWLKRVISGR